MSRNFILPFATTNTGTNLVTQAEYEVDPHRLAGNQSGIARSPLVNKALKQSTLMASGLAEFMARHSPNDADDIDDTLSPDEVADYLAAIVSSLGGSGLPPGGETGQAIVKKSDADGDAQWAHLSGVPVGTLIAYMGKTAPPGFLSINHSEETYVPIALYPQLAEAVYCGDGENDEAYFFYRFDTGMDGVVRSVSGDYLALPAAARYFVRGRDATGEVSDYAYQGDAMRELTGEFVARNDMKHPLGAFYTKTEAYASMYGGSNSRLVWGDVGFDNRLMTPTADENRPINMPVLWCIKAWDAPVNAVNIDVQKMALAWQALLAERPARHELFGVNQKWHKLEYGSERVLSAEYVNDTGKSIVLYVFNTVDTNGGFANASARVNGELIRGSQVYGKTSAFFISVVVSPGSTYSVAMDGSFNANSTQWKEYR